MKNNLPSPHEIYFFRIVVDGIEQNQTDGLAFSSREEAWQEACISTGEILGSMKGDMQVGLDWRMDVSSVDGGLIYRLTFKTEQI